MKNIFDELPESEIEDFLVDSDTGDEQPEAVTTSQNIDK